MSGFFLLRTGDVRKQRKRLISYLSYVFFPGVSLLVYFWIHQWQIKQRIAHLQDQDRFLYAGNTNQMQVALTFDDGPNPTYTPQILAILERYGVKATFFWVGHNIVACPEIVRQAHIAGHVIGNHSWSHPNLALRFKRTIQAQLTRTSDVIQQTIGVRPTFFRPPYGALNASTLTCTDELDMTTVIWDVLATDWAMPGVDVIANRVIEHTGNGSIILLHDGGGDRSETVAALPIIIENLRKRGFQFVTLQQLKYSF